MMEGIRIAKAGGSVDVSNGDHVDIDKCILCQKETGEALTGTSNGRKRISDAAAIRRDVVFKRIKLVEDKDFFYHVSSDCYKYHTHQNSLDRINGKEEQSGGMKQKLNIPQKRRSTRLMRQPPM